MLVFTSDFASEKMDVINKMSHFSFDNIFPLFFAKKILHKCTPSSRAFGKQFPGRQLVICQIFHASKPL